MNTSKPFLPRIYYLAPQLLADAAELDAALADCAGLGFDHLLLRTQLEEAQPRFDIAQVARTCRQKKLTLLLDLNLGGVARDSPLLERHAAWFPSHGREDDLPDPRYPPRQQDVCRFRYDRPEIAGEIMDYLQRRLAAWIESGALGFRCLGLAWTPPSVWRTLIADARRRDPVLRFLAWTPGCTPAQRDAIADCGFDASFSSVAWWDYRSHWLMEEHAHLQRIASPIAFPDSPDEAVLERACAIDDPAGGERAYRRALRLAAAIGSGLLVPMGFEVGLPVCAQAAAGMAARWQDLRAAAPFDLTQEVAQATAFMSEHGARFHGAALASAGTVDAEATLLLRSQVAQPDADDALIILVNADTAHPCAVHERMLLQRTNGTIPIRRLWPMPISAPDMNLAQPLTLAPAEVQVFAGRRLEPVLLPPARGKQLAIAAARAPRIAIEAISPAVDGGAFAVKRSVGESVNIEADVFMDGHDKLAVVLLWRTADEAGWHEVRMRAIGNDRWQAVLPLTRVGRHLFAVEAWRDAFATYRDELEKKTAAGLNVSVELEEGRILVEASAAYAVEKGLPVASAAQTLASSLKAARGKGQAAARDAERIALLLSDAAADAMREADARQFSVRSAPPLRIEAERAAARFASWYELFPRSQSGDPHRHGTFDAVIQRLPAIRSMGFDTLYFPPIHPIGKKHRKGRNNSLTPAPDDPGSPYAIGSAEGGHDAIHPQLGTLEDFQRLRDEAARHGMELALDFAIQCSPDHPWLKAHPDWFDWRPDGSVRYAENPPKKYQDIVNVDFYAAGAIPGLWLGLRDVVLFWVRQGIRLFRVDNPHTKPLPFWEWMIGDIRGRYPDTIFLSEAFTRPKMMHRLAKVGFSQSYTYFTWRHAKAEFIAYMTELTATDVREYFRPHFFVNTPDINPVFLQRSGRPGFLIRAALAATLSGLWGMYSGFELCEASPVPGKEEYLDSEKYQIRAWDWQRPGNIIQEITRLNRIRAENPALQTHLGLRFLEVNNDNILYFMKSSEPADNSRRLGDNVLLVAINLDPLAAHDATIELPLWEFALPDDGRLDVEDLVNGARFTWHGKRQHLRLDPYAAPYAIWRVRPKGGMPPSGD